MRTDLYTFVHKAQRYHLFKFSEELGKANISDPVEAEKMSQTLQSLLEHLKDHAYNESTYIHPLFKSIGSIVDHLENDHQKLEQEIEKIENLIQQKQWSEIYSHYSRFLGIYLLHLDEEEAAQKDIFWKHYDDQTLLAVFNRFKIERPPHLAQHDFEFMLPALNVSELTRIFLGIKASAPPHIFQGACMRASQLLTETTWAQISKAIS